MHIAILTSNAHQAKKLGRNSLDSDERYTVATSWAEITALLDQDGPQLILIEREALGQVQLANLTDLFTTGRWPPMLIVDAATIDSQGSLALARRLAQQPRQQYQIGDLHIDTRKRRAKIGDRWVTLPPIQYRLLLTLAQRAGEVVGYRELIKRVWGYEAEETEARDLVKVHIRQIRRRLGLNLKDFNYIHTMRGFGYMLSPPNEE